MPDAPHTEEPDPRIGPFLQNAGTDRMTIAWIRAGDERCKLRYAESSEVPADGPVPQRHRDTETAPHPGAPVSVSLCLCGSVLRKEMSVPPLRRIQGTDDFFYEARLTGLTPGARYAYALTCPRGGHAATFRTFPEAPDEFTFIYYGDNKDGGEMHRKVAARFDRHRPLFVLHSGDMTNHGAYEEYAPLFFDPIRDVIDHLPLFVGRGNHEGDGVAYRQVFALPLRKVGMVQDTAGRAPTPGRDSGGVGAAAAGPETCGETWYSFDCGNAHVIVLDTTGWRHDAEKDDIRRMYEWLERDLAASGGATWKIAMYHEPSYDLGWRKDDWGLKDFLPLMRRGGVDLTLSGHAHGYQRLRPMVARGQNERHPITHLISAGAGASIGQKPLDQSDFLVAQARRHNYIPITIRGERLHAQVLSDDDDLLDEFELVKHAGEYDAAILRAALWAEDYP